MFQKRYNKYVATALALLLLFFLCRNSLLQFAFERTQASAQKKYHILLSASSIRFSGFDVVSLENIVLQPEGKDTFANINFIELNLSLLDLATGKIGFDEVKVKDAFVTVYNQPERNNSLFLHQRKRETTNTTSSAGTGYRKMAMSYKSRLIRAFNTSLDVENLHLRYEDSSIVEKVSVPKMEYNLHELSGSVINEKEKDTLIVAGKVLKKNKAYEFSVTHNSITYLPFLDNEHGLKCTFKSITASLAFESTGDAQQIITNVQTENFHINHWRLANDDVVFEHAQFAGKLNVRDNSVELDSSTTVTMKSLKANLFANYHTQPDKVFTMFVHMPETVSDTFFHALPQGMFNTLKGISCTGSLSYNLFFQINTQQPDSLVFNSALNRKNFTIKHYGAENYERMNAPFTYQAYDKDRFVRNIEISSANPSFTSLHHISDYLVKSVLQSEDPSFMLHRGFLPESFRESVVKNYKERRFARGGSTISMQLVKNVFLSRDKTISRKAEEALIVYLIENLHLVPKERMLEVYLNVIEWGPNVYGIGDAAHFYFNKTPAELTLQESIFLAGIIPRPKFFKYQFDTEGKLKPYLSGYFKILTGRMAYKGWITQVDTTGLLPDVKLKGAALRMIVPSDTLLPLQDDDAIEE